MELQSETLRAAVNRQGHTLNFSKEHEGARKKEGRRWVAMSGRHLFKKNKEMLQRKLAYSSSLGILSGYQTASIEEISNRFMLYSAGAS